MRTNNRQDEDDLPDVKPRREVRLDLVGKKRTNIAVRMPEELENAIRLVVFIKQENGEKINNSSYLRDILTERVQRDLAAAGVPWPPALDTELRKVQAEKERLQVELREKEAIETRLALLARRMRSPGSITEGETGTTALMRPALDGSDHRGAIEYAVVALKKS